MPTFEVAAPGAPKSIRVPAPDAERAISRGVRLALIRANPAMRGQYTRSQFVEMAEKLARRRGVVAIQVRR
jgi:hypothetical protein